MKSNKKFFIKTFPIILSMCSWFTFCDSADAARAVARVSPTTRKAVQPTITPTIVASETDDTVKDTVVVEPEPEPEKPIIENKSDQFSDVLSDTMDSSSLGSDDAFAEEIRRQRNALAASETATMLKVSQSNALKSGRNTCDTGLRECMSKTCGADFTKCATDGDTIFGDKLNKCRRDTECTGQEFTLFSAEIKADRDMNVKLSSYNAVISCGTNYDKCIKRECGETYSNCISKAKADAAIQKCSNIAKQCSQSDSGLAARFGSVFGTMHENGEIAAKKIEKQLYEIRDKIKDQCTSLGATFDERSLTCLYTISFYAGEEHTLMASRKARTGDSFKCSPDWFGVDITTYQENAARRTMSAKSASSALMGSGIGVGVGMAASGAIGRALDTRNAEKQLKNARAEKQLKEECEKNKGTFKDGKCDLDEQKNNVDENGEDDEDESGTPPSNHEEQGTDCTADARGKEPQVTKATKDSNNNCKIDTCGTGFTPNADKTGCVAEQKTISISQQGSAETPDEETPLVDDPTNWNESSIETNNNSKDKGTPPSAEKPSVNDEINEFDEQNQDENQDVNKEKSQDKDKKKQKKESTKAQKPSSDDWKTELLTKAGFKKFNQVKKQYVCNESDKTCLFGKANRGKYDCIECSYNTENVATCKTTHSAAGAAVSLLSAEERFQTSCFDLSRDICKRNPNISYCDYKTQLSIKSDAFAEKNLPDFENQTPRDGTCDDNKKMCAFVYVNKEQNTATLLCCNNAGCVLKKTYSNVLGNNNTAVNFLENTNFLKDCN